MAKYSPEQLFALKDAASAAGDTAVVQRVDAELAKLSQANVKGAFTPSKGMQGIYGLMSAPLETAAGVGQLTGTVDPQAVAQAQGFADFARQTPIGLGTNILGHIGTAMGPGALMKGAGVAANAPRLAAAGQAAMAPSTFKGAATAGGAYAGIQPGTTEERLLSGGLGAAGGVIGQGVGKGFETVFKPRTLRPEAQLLQAEGIPLRMSEKTNAQAARWIDSALDDLPMSAHLQQQLTDEQQKGFTRAVLKRAGIDSDVADGATMQQGYQRISDIYDRVLEGKQVMLDDVFLADIKAIQAKQPQLLKTTRVSGLDDVLTDAKELVGQRVDARALQQERSQLATIARDARQAGNSARAFAYEDIVDAFDDALIRSVPKSQAKQLEKARQQYAVLKTLEKIGIDEGIISHHKLANRLRIQDKKGYLVERSDLANLAKAAHTVMKRQPQSGTGPRSLYQNLMQGGVGPGMAGGAIGAIGGGDFQSAGYGALLGLGMPYAIRRGLYSRPMQRWLEHGILGKPVPDELRGLFTYGGANIGVQQ